MSDTDETKPDEKKPDEKEPAAPADPRLAAIERAFEAGDYVQVRKLAGEVIAAEPAASGAAQAARALRRRTEVDPVQAAVIAGCLVLFLVIAYIYVF